MPKNSPKYDAISVPVAMPINPIFKTKTAIRLATILDTFTAIEIYIGRVESCIPRNQPCIAIVASMAGAFHTQM